MGHEKMNVEDLEIYQESMRISDEIWTEIGTWDFFAKDTIGKQLARCADSISANLSEGFGRFHYKENRNFCFYSRGSLDETITFLTKAKTRNLIESVKAEKFIADLRILRKRLNAYIRSIGNNSQ